MSTFDAAAWQQADPDSFDTSEPPAPGTYEAEFVNGRAFHSKGGNDIVVVTFRVLSGPRAGHAWDVLHGFKNDGQTKATKGTCSRLGVNVETVASLEDLDAALKAKAGEYFTVDVVRNGDYVNTYVKDRVRADTIRSDIPDDGSFAAPAAGSIPTSDIPF